MWSLGQLVCQVQDDFMLEVMEDVEMDDAGVQLVHLRIEGGAISFLMSNIQCPAEQIHTEMVCLGKHSRHAPITFLALRPGRIGMFHETEVCGDLEGTL